MSSHEAHGRYGVAGLPGHGILVLADRVVGVLDVVARGRDDRSSGAAAADAEIPAAIEVFASFSLTGGDRPLCRVRLVAGVRTESGSW
jgi:hypothetical protein